MKGSSTKYMNLPFGAAIDFFRQKVNLPTRKWDDLQKGMHSRAFVVAGAAKNELLADLRAAVDKGISEGSTLADFREKFDDLVTKHGWNYKGGRGWRSAVIYNTNLSTAYSAGRWQQMTDPDVVAVFPYIRYLPSPSLHPNKEHIPFYNVVLPHDDPWWLTHTPPNAFGCKCGVVSVSERGLARLKKRGVTVKTQSPATDTYSHLNKKTGEEQQLPKGISPGWDYNPGITAWGKKLSETSMAEFAAKKAAAWEILTFGNWQSYGLTETLPATDAVAGLGRKITSEAMAVKELEQILAGPEKVFSFTAANGFRYDLLVNAAVLMKHIDLNRTPYLPLIPETLTNPDEVWLRFDRHKGSGKVVLRQRIIKKIALGRKKGLLMVVEARNGLLEAWTMVPITKKSYLNKQRSGQLIYSREKERTDRSSR